MTKHSSRLSSKMRNRLIGLCVFLFVCVAAAGTALWLRQAGLDKWMNQQLADAGSWTLEKSSLTVRDVYVSGRRETHLQDVASAIGIERGDNILGFDAHEARDRLLQLGWVRDARVNRQLPDIISVEITERVPLALWQNEGKLALIGRDGEVISREGLDRFARLPLIVGENARFLANDLLTMLAGQPSLFPHVEAAVRVSDRRWNLRMRNGVTVNLPEENPQEAWRRLAEVEARSDVFKRDISAIDLRLPDRLVVRMSPASAAQRRKDGKET